MINIWQTNEDITIIFGSYIAGAYSGDTLKRKLSSVRYFLIISKYYCDTQLLDRL